MALSLESISKKAQLRAPRMLLLGPDKIGKTEFACGNRFVNGQRVELGLNSPVVLPIKGEEGADELAVPKFAPLDEAGHERPLLTFEEVLEALQVLYESDHPHRTVVIDSASSLEPLIWSYVCRREGVDSIEKACGGYGKGYTEAVGAWRQLTDWLDVLRSAKNMASILIGHVKVKRFDDPAGDSYDTYMFDVHEKAAAHLLRWADFTGFCNTKVAVKKEDLGFSKEKKRGVDLSGGHRFLFTQKRPSHPGGGRGHFGQLPYELPLDYPTFMEAVAASMQKETT